MVTDILKRMIRHISRSLGISIAGMSIAVLLLVAGYTLPLGRETTELVHPDAIGKTHLLFPGETILQSYLAPSTRQSGLVIYTKEQVIDAEQLLVRILDANGVELTRASQPYRTSYTNNDDSLKLHYTFPWITTTPQETLIAEITLTAGNHLTVYVSDKNFYKDGAATINQEQQSGDMVLGITYPTTFNQDATSGVLAAAILVLGCTLLMLLPHRWQWPGAGALLVGITPLTTLGFWYSRSFLGIADWDYYFSYHEVVRRTVLLFHQLPLWNPYICGGTAALADPEFPLFTLTFIPELLFGIPAGFRLAIYLSLGVTAIGLLVLAKRLGLSVIAGVVVAIAGTFGSVTILEIIEGHPNVFAAMWIPWVFWSWLGAYRKSSKFKVQSSKLYMLCGIFLALMFYAGGIYLLMYTTLAFITLPFLVGNWRRALITTFWSGLWALGFAAFKLVPVLLWLQQFPDKAYASSAYTGSWLIDVLFRRHLHGANVVFRQGSGWHEYGAYIGYVVAGLALLGTARIRHSRLIRALLLAAIAALILSTLGPTLRPYFDQMPFFPRSNISRIILFAILPLALLTGFGIDVLQQKIRHRRLGQTLVVLVIVGALGFDLFSLSAQLAQEAFVLPWVEIPPIPAPAPIAHTTERFDTTGSGNRHTRAYAATLAGYGTATYCSVLGPENVVRTIFDEGDNGYIMASPKSSQVRLVTWTPNRVVVDVTAAERTLLVLNTNSVPGWQANGQAAGNNSGRVSTYIDPGQHRVTFTYRPPGYPVGLLITMGTIAVAGILQRRHLTR